MNRIETLDTVIKAIGLPEDASGWKRTGVYILLLAVFAAFSYVTCRIIMWVTGKMIGNYRPFAIALALALPLGLSAQSFTAKIAAHSVAGFIDGDLVGVTDFAFTESGDDIWILSLSGGDNPQRYILERLFLSIHEDTTVQLSMVDVFAIPQLNVEMFMYPDGTHVVIIQQYGEEVHFLQLKNIKDVK